MANRQTTGSYEGLVVLCHPAKDCRHMSTPGRGAGGGPDDGNSSAHPQAPRLLFVAATQALES
ncbi:hypothetical protein P7K49_005522 [Saguinus oedipus]|uniref:Uncharacterized protein n=1 Tax=Saguinus oedipus TaxID=9490 RepID=A0ABQ9VZV6_SAGOE|nr:hypothetical protein P7K49_005522 [Saguinus oedipus]